MHRFITSKGSIYNVDGRFKFDGTVHPRGKRTVFVRNNASLLEALFWTNCATLKSSLRMVGDVLCLVVKRDGVVIDEKCRVIAYSSKPQLGYTPIETWEGKFHVGHKIVHME